MVYKKCETKSSWYCWDKNREMNRKPRDNKPTFLCLYGYVFSFKTFSKNTMFFPTTKKN